MLHEQIELSQNENNGDLDSSIYHLRAYVGTRFTKFPHPMSSRETARQLLEDLGSIDKQSGSTIIAELTEWIRLSLSDQSMVEVKYKRFSYNPQLHFATTPYPEHEQVNLTPMEGAICELLLANGGRITPYRRIMNVWYAVGKSADHSFIKTHVSHLRNKIGDVLEEDGGLRRYRHIRSRANVGYAFYDEISE